MSRSHNNVGTRFDVTIGDNPYALQKSFYGGLEVPMNYSYRLFCRSDMDKKTNVPMTCIDPLYNLNSNTYTTLLVEGTSFFYRSRLLLS